MKPLNEIPLVESFAIRLKKLELAYLERKLARIVASGEAASEQERVDTARWTYKESYRRFFDGCSDYL